MGTAVGGAMRGFCCFYLWDFWWYGYIVGEGGVLFHAHMVSTFCKAKEMEDDGKARLGIVASWHRGGRDPRKCICCSTVFPNHQGPGHCQWFGYGTRESRRGPIVSSRDGSPIFEP